MLEVTCSGTPYAIGKTHGSEAKDKIQGSIAFYEAFFLDMAKLAWPAVCTEAQKWQPFLEREYPQYIEEMRGGFVPLCN